MGQVDRRRLMDFVEQPTFTLRPGSGRTRTHLYSRQVSIHAEPVEACLVSGIILGESLRA
jgi:hypothetical protein